MTNILLYIPPPYKDSGGLGNFKLFFDICKKLGYSIFFCPLLKDINSLNFNSPFNNKPIDFINHQELINYYLQPERPCEHINITDIVTPTILKARNNVIIYPEDVFGNPAEQKYIVRWLFYFPVPEVLPCYNFEKDYICFYSDYIFNFYKHVCKSCGVPDLLTKNLKELHISRVFKFEPYIYKKINKRIINNNLNTNNKSFTLRKLFPPASFQKYNKLGFNPLYTQEIFRNYHSNVMSLKKKSYTANIVDRKNILNQIKTLVNNPPKPKKISTITDFLCEKFINMGYEQLEHKPSIREYIIFFETKDFYLSFDPFTFLSIISSLCGCVSVIKTIDGLSFNEWVNGDPFNKYGIAYGNEGIQHAKETQHLLLEHISNLYSKNTDNVIELMTNIEKKFSIKLK